MLWRIDLRESVFDYSELLSKAEVLHYLHISRWVLDKLVSAGEFPKPIRISERIVKWRKNDVEQWIKDRSQ